MKICETYKIRESNTGAQALKKLRKLMSCVAEEMNNEQKRRRKEG